MYRSNGNYEAFAKPMKPAGVDNKSAYIVGSGLAGLAAATFLIRDGQMKPDKIHILEELALPGGSMDGIWNEQKGYIIRGGREMEPHFETLWDLFRSIPSLENPDASVLDEFYWLNKKDPSYSHGRVIQEQGKELPTEGDLTLNLLFLIILAASSHIIFAWSLFVAALYISAPISPSAINKKSPIAAATVDLPFLRATINMSS